MAKIKRKIKRKIYKCKKCKDTGFIEIQDVKSKCECTIKHELSNWLSDVSKVQLKGKHLDLNLSKELPNFILFSNLSLSRFNYIVAKGLIESYFRLGTKTFSHYIVTGGEYTDAYVVGEQLKYHKAKELYLVVGFDNQNKTLQTTLYGLVISRRAKGLKTWILVTKGTSENILELYGRPFKEYLDDKTNFDKTVKG